jgi:hypothetical protein
MQWARGAAVSRADSALKGARAGRRSVHHGAAAECPGWRGPAYQLVCLSVISLSACLSSECRFVVRLSIHPCPGQPGPGAGNGPVAVEAAVTVGHGHVPHARDGAHLPPAASEPPRSTGA